MSPFRALALVLAGLLIGCAQQLPRRPIVNAVGLGLADEVACSSRAADDAARTTPEVWENFTLHFVEFDDHGWTYPDVAQRGAPAEVGNANRQLDCALAHLIAELEGKHKVALYVYVHGWHHNASFADEDVRKFRKLLHAYAGLTPDRKVIGVYLGWDGQTMTTPVLQDLLTFVSRKNAAHRVADGRVREFFGRVKGLRAHYNTGQGRLDCAERETNEDHCKLRTVMIGHSFGGLILYSAVQPYILETLTIGTDVSATREQSKIPRSQGIADLVVLLNPAFEASLFEPVHRASLSFKEDLPPLLVSLTSMGDKAVRRYFQWARNVTTVFQYPALSALESEALRDTIGNVDSYVSHSLCLSGNGGSCNGRSQHPVSRDVVCDTELGHYHARKLPVWNVRTYADIIADHNDIMGPRTLAFFEHVYSLITGGAQQCRKTELPAPTQLMAPSQRGQIMTPNRDPGTAANEITVSN